MLTLQPRLHNSILLLSCTCFVLLWPSISPDRLLRRPTFIFLKGNSKVDQLKGANKSCVMPILSPQADLIPTLLKYSALESTIQKHAVNSSSTAFSGKGHTLGGSAAAPDVVGNAKQTLDKAAAGFTQIDPQLQVFLGLIGLYLLFWYYG